MIKRDDRTAASLRPRAVIVGAGFGGLEAAKALASRDIDVTLIDKHNYHLFQPLLYQVATAALTPAEIASPIRHIFRKAGNVRVFMDHLTGVDAGAKTVTTAGGLEIPYDFLVLATGSRHSYFGREDWAPYAPGLKTIDDAFELRQRILTAFEMAEMETDAGARVEWLTFAIVGAGPTGVELAGAIAELARNSLTCDFHHIKPGSARIVLIDAGSNVLASFGGALSQAAERHLEELGDAHVQASGEIIHARTILWAAGVEASPAGRWLGAKSDKAGRIVIRSDLSVEGYDGVYAIGDTAAFTPPGADAPLPGLAPVAKQMGRYIGRKILTRRAGRTIGGFRYRDHGRMATIGRHKAIASLKGMKFSGAAGWCLWGFAHIYFLVGFRSRLTVAVTWLWSYLTWQRGVRLITGRPDPAGGEAKRGEAGREQQPTRRQRDRIIGEIELVGLDGEDIAFQRRLSDQLAYGGDAADLVEAARKAANVAS